MLCLLGAGRTGSARWSRLLSSRGHLSVPAFSWNRTVSAGGVNPPPPLPPPPATLPVLGYCWHNVLPLKRVANQKMDMTWSCKQEKKWLWILTSGWNPDGVLFVNARDSMLVKSLQALHNWTHLSCWTFRLCFAKSVCFGRHLPRSLQISYQIIRCPINQIKVINMVLGSPGPDSFNFMGWWLNCLYASSVKIR